LATPVILFGAGCGDDGGAGDDATSGPTDTSDSETGGECNPLGGDIPPLDTSSCMPSPSDYMPTVNASADDMWPACTNDDGAYHPFEQPSSAARSEAYVMMRTIFDGDLSPAAFTAAREQYSLPEGLESRCLRREDVHFPNIPEAEQDPTVDFDKQCTIEAIVTNYPDRCAGPAKIVPILNEAFVNGQTGMGEPRVEAARIDAAVEWFLYLSVIKEATFSCPPANFSGDCDAAWGYYSGATARDAAIGYGADVTALSSEANERVFDGLAAMRCWRDGYPAEMDGDTSDPLYVAGRDQLDRANNHAAALVLRDHLEQHLSLCGIEAEASWVWIQTFGQALVKPAQDADAGQAATLTALLANDAPTTEDIQGGVAALDALFPCP
jgi:hypothetical protein